MKELLNLPDVLVSRYMHIIVFNCSEMFIR
jgi:hypothetical protein